MYDKDYWIEKFKKAKTGHICWDGYSDNPSDPSLAYESSYRDVKFAEQYGFFQDNSRILDIGCGNGRIPIALSNKKVEYHGIDPMISCINFCQDAFYDFKNMHFKHIDLKNEDSNPQGKIKPIDFKLNYPDNYFDNVLCYSVFTHLNIIENAARYMMEIKRVLKPNGLLVSTWYRSPPNQLTAYTGRTTYYEHDIMTVLSGFLFLHTYGGHTDHFYDQWVIFGKKL